MLSIKPPLCASYQINIPENYPSWEATPLQRPLWHGRRETTVTVFIQQPLIFVINTLNLLKNNKILFSISGGLDDALNNILRLCTDQDVPFVFALGRRALGRACAKLVPVSCVGIFNFEGSEVRTTFSYSRESISWLVGVAVFCLYMDFRYMKMGFKKIAYVLRRFLVGTCRQTCQKWPHKHNLPYSRHTGK